MKRAKSNYAATVADQQSSGELLILPDGRVLAHNLTPALAQILSTLDPADDAMRRRAAADAATTPKSAAEKVRLDSDDGIDKVPPVPAKILPVSPAPPHSPP